MKKLLLSFLAMGFIAFIGMSFDNPQGYKIGEKAQDFKLKNIDGKIISLSDMKDVKGYIVVFTCNTCPYAVMYEDRIIDLHNKYAAKGYPVVAINPNDPALKAGDSYDEMKTRAKEKSFPFVYLFDEKQEIYPKFGATKTPHAFVLNNDRVVKYVGAIDDNANSPEDVEVNYIDDAIAALEAGKDPSPSFTKAIGCSIKSKNMQRMTKEKPRKVAKNKVGMKKVEEKNQ